MSLFKTEEFWSTRCGIDEKFTMSTLCVANFLSQPNKSDQIICGSLSGLLRMYSQIGKLSDTAMSSDGDTNPFSMINSQNEIDLCMEYNIRSPILQISAGKFVVDRTISIAVLTPQKLFLVVIDDSSMSFKVMEEFSFQRISYNFCFGNFGRVSDRDFVCVQSTDGTLSFYVNGHLSFISYLSSSLLPGPINYLAQDDSILVVSGSRFLEGYKYKNLAVSSASGPSASQKRANPDWTINIGESAIDIRICDSAKDGSLVLVLSRYSMFIINNNSGVVLKKRFENRLRSLTSYGECTDSCPRLLVTNFLGELMVFSGTSLRWKARADDAVAVVLGKFNELPGFIVTLTEPGRLAVMFLGTDPSLGTVAVTVGREIVAGNHEDELNHLQQRIKSLTTNQSAPIRVRAKESRSSLKLVVDHSSARLTVASTEDGSPEYAIDLRLRPAVAVTNVLVRLSVRTPLVARETQFHWPTLAADKDVVVALSVHSSVAMVVCSLRASVYVTYESADERLTVAQTAFTVPLALVIEACPPCKQAAFKVTVDSTETTVGLRKLFTDLGQATGPSSSEDDLRDVALGLQYRHGGPIVTLLASSTSTRYRLQSDNFEAIWIVLDELRRRLTQHFGPSFRLRFTDAVPLEAYFLVLDFHWSVRANLRHYDELLDQRARQFRAVEKLLLARTRDKAQTALQGLDSLLENGLDQLTQLADLIEEQQHHLAVVGNALCAATALVGVLLQLAMAPSGAVSEEQRRLMEHALSGAWRDHADMGLEEVLGVVLGHLLRHVVVAASGAGRGEAPLAVATLECPDNLDKLKRHIAVLCDRVAKGVPMTVLGGSPGMATAEDSVFDDPRKFVVSPRVTGKTKKSKKKKAERADIVE